MTYLPSKEQKEMQPMFDELYEEIHRLEKENEQLKQQIKNGNFSIVTHVAYQLCPKCNGQGIVSRPPWIAGDVESWMSSESSYECNLCNGKKIIPIPNGIS